VGTGWVAVLLPWVTVGTAEADGPGEAAPVGEAGAVVTVLDGVAGGVLGRGDTPEGAAPAVDGRATGAPAPGAPSFAAAGVRSPPAAGASGRWVPAAGSGRYGESTEGPPRAVLSSSAA
jgi:hypothetical protein